MVKYILTGDGGADNIILMGNVNINSRLFKFCPRCGAAALRFKKTKVLRCKSCRFEYYHNVAVAVAAIITNSKGEILLVKRAKEPGKDMLDLPGGFADYGESAEQALRREIKEELGLKVTSSEYLCSAANTYKYKEVTYQTVDFGFVCKVKDASKARPRDDVKAVIFTAPDKIRIEKFAFKSVRKIISFYIKKAANDPDYGLNRKEPISLY